MPWEITKGCLHLREADLCLLASVFHPRKQNDLYLELGLTLSLPLRTKEFIVPGLRLLEENILAKIVIYISISDVTVKSEGAYFLCLMQGSLEARALEVPTPQVSLPHVSVLKLAVLIALTTCPPHSKVRSL